MLRDWFFCLECSFLNMIVHAGWCPQTSSDWFTMVHEWCMWASKRASTPEHKTRYMSCFVTLPWKALQSSGSRGVTLLYLEGAVRRFSIFKKGISKLMSFQVLASSLLPLSCMCHSAAHAKCGCCNTATEVRQGCLAFEQGKAVMCLLT